MARRDDAAGAEVAMAKNDNENELDANLREAVKDSGLRRSCCETPLGEPHIEGCFGGRFEQMLESDGDDLVDEWLPAFRTWARQAFPHPVEPEHFARFKKAFRAGWRAAKRSR